MLSDFGATFIGTSRSPSILCIRPGFRLWIADTSGNVLKTILMKDAMTRINQSSYEVPLLNPGSMHIQPPLNFELCYMLSDNIVVTSSADCIFFLHLEQQKIVASIRRLRVINSISVRDGEVFILEGARNVIRISHVPEQICFESTQQNGPLEYQTEYEIGAEECFELPPIEKIDLETPIRTSLDEHDLLQQDKLFLEHSRRVEVFEKIKDIGFDDSILFKQSTTKKKAGTPRVKRHIPSGIVEIGQQAVLSEKKVPSTKIGLPLATNSIETSRSSLMDSSIEDDRSR